MMRFLPMRRASKTCQAVVDLVRRCAEGPALEINFRAQRFGESLGERAAWGGRRNSSAIVELGME
jgi:hypothetical protein